MVCYEEGSAQCVILNMMPGAITRKIILTVRPSYKLSTLFNDIKNQMQVDNFDISLQPSSEEEEVNDLFFTKSTKMLKFKRNKSFVCRF